MKISNSEKELCEYFGSNFVELLKFEFVIRKISEQYNG